MKLIKKVKQLTLVAAVALGFVSQSMAADSLRVGVSVPAADHGWTAGLLWWANKAADELGAKYDDAEFFVVAANSGTKQVADVEDLMVKGIDALVILPHNPNTLQRVIAEAYNEGVYTVVVDRELETPAQNVFIAGDNPGMGTQAAKYIADQLNGKGDVVVLEGLSIPINDQRVDAFEAEIAKYSGITILDSQPTDWNPQKALSVMENLLRKHQNIDAVWAGDDDVLKAAMTAIKESGRTDIKIVVGGGGSKDVIEMVRNGDPLVQATVTYSPSMVASAIALAVHGAHGEHLGDMYHGVPSRVVLAADLITEDNADEFYQAEAAY
ncbi:substrate-binding domain-containing protein [Reinekea blandensis]|uniref:Ribose ABC transporter, periplasmic D-ribose-binding protein n=1 Tax=Reinekea blandensis MED297 TaxID=314283 RepID=A4BIG2_9GAMM|nr:substrate-binding domain-containing protein [Reinekea blandensis]EAR08041.1 ribose ABC transporter, periplasmic D-ribose-binding protein [Reinekea sp. MED297] [Reinekea blandensis MED297]